MDSNKRELLSKILNFLENVLIILKKVQAIKEAKLDWQKGLIIASFSLNKVIRIGADQVERTIADLPFNRNAKIVSSDILNFNKDRTYLIMSGWDNLLIGLSLKNSNQKYKKIAIDINPISLIFLEEKILLIISQQSEIRILNLENPKEYLLHEILFKDEFELIEHCCFENKSGQILIMSSNSKIKNKKNLSLFCYKKSSSKLELLDRLSISADENSDKIQARAGYIQILPVFSDKDKVSYFLLSKLKLTAISVLMIEKNKFNKILTDYYINSGNLFLIIRGSS